MKSERAEWREIGYREGHEAGSDHLARLLQSLMDSGKSDEVNRVISDSDYHQKLLQEYFPKKNAQTNFVAKNRIEAWSMSKSILPVMVGTSPIFSRKEHL